MEKKKDEKEAYATEDPTDTSAEEQEEHGSRGNKEIQIFKLSQTFISS